MRSNKTNLFIIWLILAAIVTALTGLVYAGVQQNYRADANDPQTEITEEIAEAISKGAPPDQIIPPSGGTDIKNSLSAFAMILDKDGKVVGSSAKLNDKEPVPPKAMLEEAKKQKNSRNIVTWEPEKGVRVAAVVRATKSGNDDVYVLAGKSLSEVENRIKQLTTLCLIAWIVLLFLTTLFTMALSGILKGLANVVEKETEVVVIEETAEDKKSENA